MKTIGKLLFYFLLAAVVGADGGLLCDAQTPAPASSAPMPKDPAALMQLAAQTNGLAGTGLKPWHLELSYQQVNDAGKPLNPGTIEIWWAAPKTYKIAFSTAESQTLLYGSPSGLYLSGDKVLDPDLFFLLHFILSPLPDPELLSQIAWERKLRKVDGAKLDCVTSKPGPPIHVDGNVLSLTPADYCFELDRPLLRVVQGSDDFEILYETIATLEGRYIGDKVDIVQPKSMLQTAHLVAGNVFPKMAPMLTAMPPDAANHLYSEKGELIQDLLLTGGKKTGGENPQYTPMAKSLHAQGAVVMEVTIGTDGAVHQLKVLSSDSPLLTESALKAVRTWRYQPYSLGGKPVTVRRTIRVVYHLGQLEL